MKLASLAFFLLLVIAHMTGDPGDVADLPLSTFRDGPRAWIGYALFTTLLLVGLTHFATLLRCGRRSEAVVSGLAFLLLLAVTATPSEDSFHLLTSLILLALLFGYYAVLLYRAEKLWLVAHLAVPIALALVIRWHSYGLWQKSFIAYFVFLAAAHHFVLTLPLLERRSRRSRLTKRRKVYQLDPMQARSSGGRS
jgi:hypothetical protein